MSGYDRSRVPTVGNVVCDRKRGSVRCGLSIHQDESLPEHKGEDDSESCVCHGPARTGSALPSGADAGHAAVGAVDFFPPAG
ncbi:hypothetical protein UK14_15870 [Streptomyces sp. NRRL F-4428]|nr:hypothetical protein UK14_15870 [Streptomyces sp. NRRL F-4428]